MFKDDDIEELKGRKICFNCVGEDFLKSQISNPKRYGICFYCNEETKHITIEELSELIETAFDQHYCRTLDHPTSLQHTMLTDKESDYEWERDGEEVVYAIMNAADIPEEAASDIQTILEAKFYDFESAKMGEETEFSSGTYYEESGTNDERWQDEWRGFEHLLRTEARFFSRSASCLLTSVFKGIDTMRTRDGRPLIVDAGPGTEFSSVFRARCFQLDEKLKNALAIPDKHLGSPPSADAYAGRMNAHGISVFYGANNPQVALAEVRPPVGSQVAVARFDIIRPIRLLDLTALSEVSMSGSIFDPTFIDLLEQTMFLRNLSHRITIPVMPDHETFEYLTTQAIADFLATENEPSLDGVIYPSVQAVDVALNFVLFHQAARVGEIELPKRTEISVALGQMYEEGWEREYTVIEEVPPQEEEPKNSVLSVFEAEWPTPGLDARLSTLKIDLNSVRVHTVDSVKFSTSEYPVLRHRWEKVDPEF